MSDNAIVPVEVMKFRISFTDKKSMVLFRGSEEIVSFNFDGTTNFHGNSPDEAAKAFWGELLKYRNDSEKIETP